MASWLLRLAFVFGAVAVGCSADTPHEESAENVEAIVEGTPHVIDVEPGVDVEVRDDALVFPEPLRPDVGALGPGDVVVSGRGAGFLRRIRSLTHDNGKAVVTTEPAALTDVFRQARINGTSTTPIAPRSAVAPQSFSLPLPVIGIRGLRVPLNGQGSEITIEEGSFDLTPAIDYDLVLRDRAIDRMKFVVSGQAKAKLRVKYHLQKPPYVGTGVMARFGEPGIRVAEGPTHYSLVWIGGIPVVLVVKTELLLGYLLQVGGDVSGELSFSSNGDVAVGASYDGEWHNQTSSTVSFALDGDPNFASATLGGDVTLSARLSLSFYDLGGPWVELQGYGGIGRESGAAAQIGHADVFAELGLRGLVGVEVAPFGRLVVGYQAMLFDKNQHLPLFATE